jgi:hypothetical protein
MDKEKSAIKIQLIFKINNCLKKLENFNNIKLTSLASSISFGEFQKIICKKDVLEASSLFIKSLNMYKSGVVTKSLYNSTKIFISSFLIKFYSNELLGEMKDWHLYDTNVYNSANNLIDSITGSSDSQNIKQVWDNLFEFNTMFLIWSSMDKDRTIEKLIISYYYRCEHIDKIKDDNSNEFEQKLDMLEQLEKQKSELIRSIIIIDKDFDIEYLKKNYVEIFNNIMASWQKIESAIALNMKKAYYNMLIDDIKKGEMMSTFNLLKDIGNRLLVLCPEKRKTSFQDKFSDNMLLELLQDLTFNNRNTEFINFIVDFICLMDAPINDMNNKKWKDNINILFSSDFSICFPNILLQIEEHIDMIYDLIIKLQDS